MSLVAADTIRLLRSRLLYAWAVIRNPSNYDYFGINIPMSSTREFQRARKRIYLGLYERDELDAVRKLVQADDIVVEVGAGCGVVSTAIAQKLINHRNLHCFEANPALLESIEAVTKANKVCPNVTIAAVGTVPGEMELYSSEDFLSSSLVKRNGHDRSHLVRVIGFDDLLGSIRPTLLLMDVEGAEQDLLCGQMPDSLHTIVAELHPHVIGNRAVSKIIQNLVDQAFDILLDLSNERVMAFSRMKGSDRLCVTKGPLGERWVGHASTSPRPVPPLKNTI